MEDSGNSSSNKQASGECVQQEATIYEDEINLREYIQAIVKRRKWIAGIFLTAIVSATIYSLRMFRLILFPGYNLRTLLYKAILRGM